MSCCLLVLAFSSARARKWRRSPRKAPIVGAGADSSINSVGSSGSDSSSTDATGVMSWDLINHKFLKDLSHVLSAVTLFASFVALVVLWLRHRWNTFYESAVEGAFSSLDMDQNGLIDSKELYAGVLLIYMRLKGLVRLRVPTHDSVMRLLQVTDVDDNGLLDAEEFRHTMDLLSGQLLARFLVQVVLILSCPFLASVAVKGVASAIQREQEFIRAAGTRCEETLQKAFVGRALLAVVTPLGKKVLRTWKDLPASFPATLVTVIMVNLINSWLYLIDDGLARWHKTKWI